MRMIDGWGKEWNRTYIPEYIKELNNNPIGIVYEKDGWWFSRHLKLKNADFKIDVLFELIDKPPYYRMFTDDLKYGDHLEIIFDGKTRKGQVCSKQCFVIKNIDRLRAEWRKNHSEYNVIDDVFDDFANGGE